MTGTLGGNSESEWAGAATFQERSHCYYCKLRLCGPAPRCKCNNEKEFSKCATGLRFSFPVLGSSHCWRWLQTLPRQGEVSEDSVVVVLAESGPEASGERALPWSPWAVCVLQPSDGPAGVAQCVRVGA